MTRAGTRMDSDRYVRLECRRCQRTWRQLRRLGQPPEICARCRRTERSPPTLARQLRRHGLDARVLEHRRFGASTWTQTPWHKRPVRIADLEDVHWLLKELGH